MPLPHKPPSLDSGLSPLPSHGMRGGHALLILLLPQFWGKKKSQERYGEVNKRYPTCRISLSPRIGRKGARGIEGASGITCGFGTGGVPKHRRVNRFAQPSAFNLIPYSLPVLPSAFIHSAYAGRCLPFSSRRPMSRQHRPRSFISAGNTSHNASKSLCAHQITNR